VGVDLDLLNSLAQSGALNGRQPQTRNAPTASAAEPSRGELFGRMIDDVHGAQDPVEQAIISGVLSKALGFHIPTRAELDLRRMQQEMQVANYNDRRAALMVREAWATMMDNKDKLGVDEGVINDPVMFEATAKRLWENGLIEYQISQGDMIRAGYKPVPAGVRMSEELSRAVSTEKNAVTVEEMIVEAGSGDNRLGEIMAKFEQLETERTGTDFTSFLGITDTDIDTDEGSRSLRELYDGAMREMTTATGGSRKIASRAFLERWKDDIQDQLQGLPSSGGKLVVGQGDRGVTDTATFFLSHLLLTMAHDMGIDQAAIMQLMGLEYSGIDEQSYNEMDAKVRNDAAGAPQAAE
jgi:hypothetical protein